MFLNPTVSEWLNLFLRWTHVFAGIMWVGTTYYFTWLDGRFSELESKVSESARKPGEEPEKNVWMVHSGGFYRVEKQKVPNVMPEKLHWFRWEAAIATNGRSAHDILGNVARARPPLCEGCRYSCRYVGANAR